MGAMVCSMLVLSISFVLISNFGWCMSDLVPREAVEKWLAPVLAYENAEQLQTK